MKSVVYGLGILLLIVATASAVAEASLAVLGGGYRPLALGAIWYRLHARSLLDLRASIEQTLDPALWLPVGVLLALPAWVVFAVPGLIMVLLSREGSHHR